MRYPSCLSQNTPQHPIFPQSPHDNSAVFEDVWAVFLGYYILVILLVRWDKPDRPVPVKLHAAYHRTSVPADEGDIPMHDLLIGVDEDALAILDHGLHAVALDVRDEKRLVSSGAGKPSLRDRLPPIHFSLNLRKIKALAAADRGLRRQDRDVNQIAAKWANV